MSIAQSSRSGHSITAAAQVLQGPRMQRTRSSKKPKNSPGLSWQLDAWDYYDKVGEFSFGVDMLSWAVSRVRLVAGREVANQDEPEVIVAEAPEGSTEEIPEADVIAAELIGDFAGGATGQRQLIRRVATQLIVAAESYIVGRTIEDVQVWEAYSREEVKYTSNMWKVDDGTERFDLGEDDVLIRVWIPSARRRSEPRSSTKPLLSVLQEIYALSQSIAAQVDSRLAGAGMLVLPKSVELVGGSNAGDSDEEDQLDPFIAELMDMMITPIKDRDSAAAVVPIVIKVEDEAVGKIQYLRFDAPSDSNDADKREKAVVRLARAMDLPQEQLTGLGDSNHWTGWLVEENTIKGPVSDLAGIVVHALTIGWYRPALEQAYADAGIEEDEARDRLVWFDAAALEQRPDRSEQAVQVFDRGGLSLLALARENGFDESDLPDAEELARIMLFLLIKNRPELAVPLIDTSGLLERIIGALDKARDPVEDPAQGELPADESAGDADPRQLPDQPSVGDTGADGGGTP